jgi:ubiquitin C-terminal hydrolase
VVFFILLLEVIGWQSTAECYKCQINIWTIIYYQILLMSRFETSNSAYGSYLRSGNSNYKPNRNTMMSIEKPKLDIQQNHQKLPAMDIHQHKTQILGDGRPRGLINLRNTCYINSILQILFEILEVPANSPISASYMALRNSHSKEDYWEFKDRVEAKLDIVQGHYQQDAQEFLRGLLELLNQENKVGGSSTLAKKKAEFQVNPKYLGK